MNYTLKLCIGRRLFFKVTGILRIFIISLNGFFFL